MIWHMGVESAAPSLTSDFRRTLQMHIDAIVLRDIELYGLTLGPDDTPCLRQGNEEPVMGRDAIVAAMEKWFADRSLAFHHRVLWTFEQERTAIAMLELMYTSSGEPRRELQLLVFQRPRDGWRLVLDHRV